MTRQVKDAVTITPFQIALDVRRQISQSMTNGIDYNAIVSNEVAACLIGLPTEALNTHFSSILISPSGDISKKVVVGTTMLAAQAAFDAWSSDNDPRLQLHFDIATYEALFGLIQIARTATRTQVIRHMQTTPTALILESLALREADQNWHSLATTVAKEGEFDADTYMTQLQNELVSIEERLQTSALGKEALRKHPLSYLFDTAKE